ncbi:nuclear transport factor 2 family protein [Nocardioides houyundeii]|uniref:nuclear transport factor 2 family protein n=1 Tax=Nocardioides houyundeii TaxID=2045452 RepID=UPI000C75DA2F|nr:nuclear transport factor 2 family protein [Nocardioides houyundeii]
MSTPSTPEQIALAYHRAWTSREMDAAMSYVADDVVCEAPAGRLHGAEALRAFMGPFAAMLTSSDLLAAYGDEHSAVVFYDTSNPVVASAPAAEFHQVRDGRIAALRIVFDRLPFALARGEVVPGMR